MRHTQAKLTNWYHRRRKALRHCFVTAILLSVYWQPSLAHAASDSIFFGGNITTNNACIVIVREGGTLVSNPEGNQLSSLLAGGSSGIAEVFAIFPYDISVDAQSFFSSGPPGANDNVTHTAYFSGRALNRRGINFPIREGSNPVSLGRFFSRTEVTVDLVADRPDQFPNGTYSTQAIVRCE